MPLNKMEIHGFRGFRHPGTINFAIPNGNFGSGLTFITGPNNSGKSSILECLKARAGHASPSFSDSVRHAAVEEVTIRYSFADAAETIKSIRKGSSESTKNIVDADFHIFVLQSRRAFNPYFGKNDLSRMDIIRISSLAAQRSSTLSQFEGRLFRILQNPDDFNKILYEVLTTKPVWSIDMTGQGNYYLKFFNAGSSHTSDGMGEGIISVFAIIDALYDSKQGDVIVIDEPELSLHPALQKRLFKVLARYAKDRQIVLATHSPYFVDVAAIRNGAHLVRVVSDSDGTKIHELTPNSKDSIKSLGIGNLNNPHVFGLDARELFFQEDCIVLTEGQEDVVLFPKVASQVNAEISGSFFGWVAGGASNFMHLCHILQDLGFLKVTGILDNDKMAERDKLAAAFPNYLFVCIPAKDIRSKSARKAADAINGLLDTNQKIRKEYVESMRELFGQITKHMMS